MLNRRSERQLLAADREEGSLDLEGRIALVTGGARGLGRCEAEALAMRGALVAVCDITKPDDTVRAIGRDGGTALSIQADLAFPEAVHHVFEQVLAEWGHLNYLVNNAGVVADGMIFNLTEADWDHVIAVNLTAPFTLSSLAAGHWRERHRAYGPEPRAIVNTSSESGLYGNAGQANYAAAKAGVVGLTMTLAAELDQYNGRANVIAPRARTPMSATAFGDLPQHSGFDPYAPEPIADLVAWLVSDAAAAVTGQVLVAHGSGVEVVGGWQPRRQIEHAGRWNDASLRELCGLLFDADGRHVPGPVSDLFGMRRPD